LNKDNNIFSPSKRTKVLFCTPLTLQIKVLVSNEPSDLSGLIGYPP
jgi:hypothetical protein